MQKEFNTQAVLTAIRKIGDAFLQDYKRGSVPPTRAVLLERLAVIDARSLTSLKADLTPVFPETPWYVGDEFDTDGQKTPVDVPEYWLCDAMDGAIQYLQHIPGWTINLVLIRQGQPYFAVIYDPLANELFWAQKGAGAFMNGVPLKLSDKKDLAAMLAVFEYGHQDKSSNGLNRKIGASLTDLLEQFGIVRNYGPHGLQLAYVGAGRIDFFHQQDLDTYNWLAGILIASEAGAEILTTDGLPWEWGAESLMVAAPGTGKKFIEAKSLQLNP